MKDIHHEDSDWQHIQQIQMGNRDSADQLMIKYQMKVMRLALRYVNEAEAKDIVQETFIKVFRGLKAFRGDSSFYTWLHRIALNTAKNYLVTKGHRGFETDIEDVYLSDQETPEQTMQKEETEGQIFHAIEALPSDLRMTIILRELDGLSYEAIAKMMDCPVGTVRSRISRARESIEDRLQ